MKRVRITEYYLYDRATDLHNGKYIDFKVLTDKQIEKVISQYNFKTNKFYTPEKEYIITILKEIKRDRILEKILN